MIYPYGREAAREAGYKKYTNKQKCRRGHSPIRFTSNGMCCECVMLLNEKRKTENREEDNAKKRERYKNNNEEMKEKQRSYYKRNAEKLKKKRRQYVKENYEQVRKKKKQHRLDNLGQYKEKERKYHWDNKEERNAKSREYNRRTGYCKKHHAKNREARNAYSRDYGKRNPEIYRAKHARRRSIQGNGASGPELREWIKRQKKHCYWCGVKCPDDFHVDHYVPLSKGGLHELDNIVIACPDCNLSKHAKDPYEFANQIGRLF